ncbi:hypothetical protein [Pseudomonas huanghezhanensis]|uniref:hypothetical protein n=1 Tax=Pseudomonas huanghezhanensis TaxID=3002903 RepID=UPI0022857528|nr:hypothetical protein [Pseudomonas sp. BSw22131]
MMTCTSHADYISRLHHSCLAHNVDAETQSALLKLAEQQIAMSADELYQRQADLFGPNGIFARFSAQVMKEGRQAAVFDDLMTVKSRQRQRQVEQAVNFALCRHHRRVITPNPFSNRSRESLCRIIYDETGAFTLVERYGAYEAIRVLDSDFFIKLIATTRGVVERRIVFCGLLEHFDRLLPIEQSIYPDNYREAQEGHLQREEALYGKLQLGRTLNGLLAEISPALLLQKIQGMTAFKAE